VELKWPGWFVRPIMRVMQQDRYPGFALSLLQSRLDSIQAQHLILGKRTDIGADDRQQLQSAIYSELTKLWADWDGHLAWPF